MLGYRTKHRLLLHICTTTTLISSFLILSYWKLPHGRPFFLFSGIFLILPVMAVAPCCDTHGNHARCAQQVRQRLIPLLRPCPAAFRAVFVLPPISQNRLTLFIFALLHFRFHVVKPPSVVRLSYHKMKIKSITQDLADGDKDLIYIFHPLLSCRNRQYSITINLASRLQSSGCNRKARDFPTD